MIKDQQQRTFEKLRISLNEHCNFSCTYCVDPTREKKQWNRVQHGKLTTVDYLAIVERLKDFVPIDYIRLTGGEPLLFKELNILISGLKRIGISKVSLTTNAFLLEARVKELHDSGLDSLNVSLDAVEIDPFEAITGEKDLDRVLRGIERSVILGMPIKLNSVIMKGINDSQVLPLLEFGRTLNISVRYIELMKMGWVSDQFDKYFYSAGEILKDIARKYSYSELNRAKSSTANLWEINDGYRFGIIANESRSFCQDCNRLRLDSSGKIYGCLSNPLGLQLGDILSDDTRIMKVLKLALGQKQKEKFKGSNLSMLKIGG